MKTPTSEELAHASQRCATFVQKLESSGGEWPDAAGAGQFAWLCWSNLNYLAGTQLHHSTYRFAIARRAIDASQYNTEKCGSLDMATATLSEQLCSALHRLMLAANATGSDTVGDEAVKNSDALKSAIPGFAAALRLVEAGAELQKGLGVGDQMPDLFRVGGDGLFPLDAALLTELRNTGELGKGKAKRVAEIASEQASKWRERIAFYRNEIESQAPGRGELAPWLATQEEATEALSRWAIPDTATTGISVFGRDAEPWPAPLAVLMIAEALWRDIVKPRLEIAFRKPPALAMAVAEPIAHLFSTVRREEERNGQRRLRLPGEVLVKIVDAAATIGADALNAIMIDRIDRGVKLFGSLASHRVLRWQIFTAHRQALNNNPDPRVLRVDGGWSVLAHDVLGMNGNKAADQVRDIIEAMHVTELPLPPHGDYSRLLIRETHTPRGRGKQWIKLVLGTVLLPDYVHELQEMAGNTIEARRWSRLVPVLDLPPAIGQDNEHGAQATFSMLLVAYLRDHAQELVEHGGVRFSETALGELARGAGLPIHRVRPLLDRWVNDGTDGPAFLKVVDGGRHTLGDAHATQREFIEKGGRREIEGRRAGQRGAARRVTIIGRKGRIPR